jgi:hypothetical protein
VTTSYDAFIEETRELALLDNAPRPRPRKPDAGVVLGLLSAAVLVALAALL